MTMTAHDERIVAQFTRWAKLSKKKAPNLSPVLDFFSQSLSCFKLFYKEKVKDKEVIFLFDCFYLTPLDYLTSPDRRLLSIKII